jgi:RNA polymerase sigma-70 factor (ECF subfamily)
LGAEGRSKSNSGVTFSFKEPRGDPAIEAKRTNVHFARRQEVCDLSGGIETHRDYLYYNALGRLRNREQAEDAVQDAFLAALGGTERFHGASSQRTWLTAILKHKVCDQMRRACRDRTIFESREPTDNDQFENDGGFSVLYFSNPRTELERKELRAAIEQALAKLPHRLAEAFSLYEIEDWNGRKVCSALGISENNLWFKLHEARKQLRGHLASWNGFSRRKYDKKSCFCDSPRT